MPHLIFESYWKATNTPSTPTIYPDTSNQNFEKAILFNVVERSENYIFDDYNPPTALRVRDVNYALGAYKVFIDRVFVKLQKGLIQFEIERASALCNSRK